jgi:hypothetical protein
MKAQFLIVLCAVLGLLGETSAQVCSVGYDRSERRPIQASGDRVSELFDRMAQLAEMSASETISMTQRLALENEFHALKDALREAGDRNRPRLSVRGNTFLHEVIDPDYLGLTELRLRGDSIAESQQLARIALDAVNQARSLLTFCLSGSWDRVALVGTPNDGPRGGGYSRADRRIVSREIRGAQASLSTLAWIAHQSANGVFSTTQRAIQQFDFEFTREDIELRGRGNFPGVSRRTRTFLRTVIDPTFLGIDQSVVNGESIEESHVNAGAALERVRGALSNLDRCGR